ncbi:MAG: hypothetical protein M3405_17340 [Acidobacteriota bacterium]|jgi:hypothetical protein|nr:hypothetical protein [Acidobacteriota bacterium]
MLSKNILQKLITSFTLLAVMSLYSTVSLAASGDTALITTTGAVTVNGQPAVSNSTISSDSTVTTGENSTALISMGSNGKVELMPNSSITLKFSDNSFVAMMVSGKIRVMNSAGISSTVTTKSATVVGDTGQANSYSVDIGCGDTAKCSATFVETMHGLVTLRSGNSVKQVAAGADASSGNTSQIGCKPCFRPGSAPPTRTLGIGTAGLAALLIAAGVVGGLALFLGRDNDVNFEGGAVVVSPIR